jgi:hypothetical protein
MAMGGAETLVYNMVKLKSKSFKKSRAKYAKVLRTPRKPRIKACSLCFNPKISVFDFLCVLGGPLRPSRESI